MLHELLNHYDMCIKDSLMRFTSLLVSLVALMSATTSCYDDLEFTDPDSLPDGTAEVKAVFDFTPMISADLDSRASVAPSGDAFKDITDLCVVIYDHNQKLLDIKEFQPEELGLTMQNRYPSDAVNNKPAEEKTWHGTAKFNLKYGKYYIFAVANLGQTKNGVTTSTRDVLEQNSQRIQTVDGLKALKVTFDPYSAANNREMLGYFTEGKAPSAPSSADCDPLIVSRSGIELHSWLRRCISKVTVDFDPSGLNENIRIYLRRVTVRDVPVDCPLGFFNVPDSIHKLLRIPGNSIAENATAHRIEFGDFMDGKNSESDDYADWPMIEKASDPFPANAHSETAKALILYENMQGTGKDKRQYADADGLVADRDIVKDNKPFGSYIEVEAYYQNLNAGQLTQGKIIYRFMLGQNVIDNYDTMRNCHYKLTLAFRGNANDVDWHIEYADPDPVVVPRPYYISYLYNHNMVLPLRMTPENPADRITSLKAEITKNRWWPEGGSKGTTYFSDGICDTDDEKNHGNGFLSLKPVHETNVIHTGNYWEYNDPYYRGKKDNINRSSRTEYPVSGTKTYSFTSSLGTKSTVHDTVTAMTFENSNAIEWGIPMYTRAKNLVIPTGYTGNNPYTGHYRVAEVLFTATLNNNPATTMTETVTIRQVERIVNPKGVYRKWNSREPFHVRLKKLADEGSDMFVDYVSNGPWRAYIVRGDRDFIDIGRPGNKTAQGSSGSEIDFNIRFKGTGSPTKVKSCVIRVEYNNYSCYHLIFVRQGYEPVPIVPGGNSWYVTNMLAPGVPAEHPCDEGSMFKYGNWDQPIDVSATIQLPVAWPSLTQNHFLSRTDKLPLYGGGSEYWTKIDYHTSATDGFSTDGGKVAETSDFNLLVEKCEVGFGVLYADGATETASDIATAYGYNRAKGQTAGYGMRGAFAYNATIDPTYGGRSIFFPIGFTGYGQRKDVAKEGGSGLNGVLRYAAGRWQPMAPDEATKRPILWDLYRKMGAIYWARTAIYRNKELSLGGLDINYFSLDFNNIDATNIFKINSNKEGEGVISASNACFVRCIK